MTAAPTIGTSPSASSTGKSACRVQRQKLLAPRPRLFLDQGELLAIFAKGEADKATGRK